MQNFLSPFHCILNAKISPKIIHNFTKDECYLYQALSLAQKGLGLTSPNPPVGAIIVKDNKIVGKGYHAKAGQDHAEIIALKEAGQLAKNATMYVTLEPCCHYGKTPPCVKAIIQTGINRVVVGHIDPNIKMSGKGILQLRNAQIAVKLLSKTSTIYQRINYLLHPFIKNQQQKLPWIVAKIATTLDGKIAKEKGIRSQITSLDAKRLVHKLRSKVDAILVGANTVKVDNPLLDLRLLNTHAPPPLKIVLDSSLTTDPDSQIYNQKNNRCLVVHATNITNENLNKFNHKAIETFCVDSDNSGKINLKTLLIELYSRGLSSVMIESGGILLGAMLQNHLVDEMWWFTASKIFGQNAVDSCLFSDNYSKKDIELIGTNYSNICQDNLFIGKPVNLSK